MSRAYGSLYLCGDTDVVGIIRDSYRDHPYNMNRAYGSDMLANASLHQWVKCQHVNPVGMVHFVTTDFNPLT